ncbi:MAG: SusD/RagB family nutrient-binding outer membrane lipoprotein [Marinilabiliaceae bacterium]|nr:SusD/RagB family nutrient-binding outer membrane lipoprotein [Marinilabiliaceae bacterium]
MKKIFKIVFALSFIFAWGCDKDEFADLNSNPSELVDADIRYLSTQAMRDMYGNDYTNWFYDNFQYIQPWTQVAAKGNGNKSEFIEMGAAANGQDVYDVFPETKDIRFRIDEMTEEDQKEFQALKAITYAMQIQPAITRTDLIGSMVYTEAGMAAYTNPPLITPVVDNQELLFKTWLAELDGAIAALSNTDGQFGLASQDLVYNGDYTKWAKFCNLLKLKIAARLINVDRAQAIKIAEEVAKSSVGYMDDLSDDFVYQRGIEYYGTGNGMWIGSGSKNLIDFMITNLDPRVRFTFNKNEFNAEVVQAFIDAGKELPPYVKQFVTLDADGNFESWNGPGEPWVRYYGAPVSPDAKLDGKNNIYFDQGNLYKIKLNEVEKSYGAVSSFSERIVRTEVKFTYPTKPGGRVLQNKDYKPLNVILGSAAETNLYLAEFSLLGATLPQSAQIYFNRGVELSVRRADALANNNGMVYYKEDPVYTNDADAAAGGTYLRENEIADLLKKPAFDLATDGLEKVYIQQYINFLNTPGDIWTLTRRSGIPKKGSAYLAWEDLKSSGAESVVPRRFVVATPTEDSKNYANDVAAVKEQGFTSGKNDPEILNAERLWFDKQNPKYGEGPK